MRFITEGSTAREAPKQPIVERFAYRHVLDEFELEMLRRDPEFKVALKRSMAQALANAIVEKCQLFELPSYGDLYRGLPIQMEIVINDRGAHQNMLPHARQEGRREGLEQGVKRTLESLPHGIDPTRVWE